MHIHIILPHNRLLTGKLGIYPDGVDPATCIPLYGPYPCIGRADTFLAQKANNPARDPLKPNGDTPLGTFTGTVVPPGDSLRSYGPHPRILLTPAPPTRSGLMIHGGAPGSGGGLRPTEGCVRVTNDDMQAILEVFGESGKVVISEGS